MILRGGDRWTRRSPVAIVQIARATRSELFK